MINKAFQSAEDVEFCIYLLTDKSLKYSLFLAKYVVRYIFEIYLLEKNG